MQVHHYIPSWGAKAVRASSLPSDHEESALPAAELPPVMCAWCQKVRDGNGDWVRAEGTSRNDDEVAYSHGICTACQKAILLEFDDLRSG